MRRFASLYRRVKHREPDPPPCPLHPVAVVGDIHGRYDLLRRLLAKLDGEAKIVFVGDLVDRGEASAEVLREVCSLVRSDPDRITCLMGNHEYMLLNFLKDPSAGGARWIRNGGLQTLASFGIGGLSETSSEAALTEAAAKLRDRLSADVLEWLSRLPLLWRSGNLTAVHAAADPSRPIESQDLQHLLWGHPDFLSGKRRDGQWVVHGHTVVEQPVIEKSRIAIDTGAYFTGRLCAAQFYPNRAPRFVTT